MKAAALNPKDVEVRPISAADLDDLIRYFYHSPPGFMESIGIDPAKLDPEPVFRERWTTRIAEKESAGEPMQALIVFYRGERVGLHSSTHYAEGESLVMHAHFFRPDLRGLGIGTISYVKAIEYFLKTLGLKEVLFKTPVQNTGAMKIKEKLGLSPEGEEVLDWPLLRGKLPAKVYRVNEARLAQIKAHLRDAGVML